MRLEAAIQRYFAGFTPDQALRLTHREHRRYRICQIYPSQHPPIKLVRGGDFQI
jgi:hypothetical protein